MIAVVKPDFSRYGEMMSFSKGVPTVTTPASCEQKVRRATRPPLLANDIVVLAQTRMKGNKL
jgi:hypothetical protein